MSKLPKSLERPSRLRREIDEIPAAVARLLDAGRPAVQGAARQARALSPRFLISVARGSSDHAATYLKYASELLLGLPMASVGPSVASIYHAPLNLEQSLCIAISQSGRSPDIVELTRSAGHSGALTLAITNQGDSPLAQVAAHTIDIQAGTEHSVAATKTFVTSLVAGLWMLAEWKQDKALIAAIHDLPAQLERAAACDWSAPLESFARASSLYVLGRGPTWAIANEAALKLKETAQIHAESYSSAEVMHGPVSIVDRGFPILLFAVNDAAEAGLIKVADDLAARGALAYITATPSTQATVLEHVRTSHWLCDPISLIVTFYAMAEKIARLRGLDPDTPRNLKKVTETV